MLLSLLFFLIFLPTIQGCLVLRTPGCDCRAVAFTPSNYAATLGAHPFFPNVSGLPIQTPVFTEDECYAEMHCADNYSLVIFDLETATVFGEYSAEGMCSSGSQTWLVDDGNGLKEFKRLFGICVDYRPPQPPTTPSSLDFCGCKGDLIDESNAHSLLGDGDFYASNLSHYQLVRPIARMEGCKIVVECPSGLTKLLIADAGWAFYGYEELTCEYNRWVFTISEGGYEATVAYMVCVDFGAPKPSNPLEHACGCKANVIDDSNAQSLIGSSDFYAANLSNYPLVRPSAHMSGCMINMGCPSGYSTVVIGDNRWNVVDLFEIFCIEADKNWQVTVWDNEQISYSSPFVYITCIAFTIPTTSSPLTSTVTPSPFVECGCQAELIDDSNAKTIIGHYDVYLNTLFKYNLVKPTPWIQVNPGLACQADFNCPTGLTKILIGEDRWHEVTYVDMYCWEKRWELFPVINVTYSSPFAFMTCVDYNAPKPVLPPPTCACSHTTDRVSIINPGYELNNFDLQVDVSADHCSWKVSCRTSDSLVTARIDNNVEIYHPYSTWLGQCVNNKWNLSSPGGGSWAGINVFQFNCIAKIN